MFHVSNWCLSLMLCLTSLLTCWHVEYIQATLLKVFLSITPSKVQLKNCTTLRTKETRRSQRPPLSTYETSTLLFANILCWSTKQFVWTGTLVFERFTTNKFSLAIGSQEPSMFPVSVAQKRQQASAKYEGRTVLHSNKKASLWFHLRSKIRSLCCCQKTLTTQIEKFSVEQLRVIWACF